MFGFQEKRRMIRMLYSKPTMIVLFIAIILMAYAAHGAYQKERTTDARRVLLSEELHELEARAGALSEDIAHFEDPRGIETELRQRYDVGREGEEIIIFVETPSEEIGTEVETPQPTGLFARMWYSLTGKSR